MKLIPEQKEWYLNQVANSKEMADKAFEAQAEVSKSERYRASIGNQDCATAAEQVMFEQGLYYADQTSMYERALSNISLPKPNSDGDIAEVGSYVTISYKKNNGKQIECGVLSVLLIEGELGNRHDLDIKCASISAGMGKALLGAWPGDTVEFTTRGKITYTCTVEEVDNNFIYERYPEHYEQDTIDLTYTR